MSSIFTIGPVPPAAFTAWSFEGGTIVEVKDQLDSVAIESDALAA